MAALFGGTGRSESKNLVEFKAGKMFMKEKMVHPDKRKGLLYVYQSDDNLIHLCWKDRGTSKIEDDLIIVPDDAEFKHVPACTTGRVYVLMFKSSKRKLFFWMQEPKSDKDDEFCKKVNDSFNKPPTPGSGRAGGGPSAGGMGGLPSDLASLAKTAGFIASEGDLQSLLGNMSQQQLMHLFSGMGMSGAGGVQALFSGGRPSSAQSSTVEQAGPTRVQSSPGPRATADGAAMPPRAVTAAGTRSSESEEDPVSSGSDPEASGGIALSDLQNILTSMNVPLVPEPAAIDLNDVLNPDTIIPLLAKPEVQEKLTPLLPEGNVIPKTEEELRATVSSPQFRQAVTTFGEALRSGDLAPVMAQFDISDEAKNQAAKGDVKGFAEALQAPVKKDEPAIGAEDVEMNEESDKK